MHASEELIYALRNITSGQSFLPADMAERIRWYVVSLRDKGEVILAERLFDYLHQSYPDIEGFLVELLFINVFVSPDREKVLSIASRQMGSDIKYIPSSAAFLLTFDALRSGNMEAAYHFWKHVNKIAECSGPFRQHFSNILATLASPHLSQEEQYHIILAFLEQSAREGRLDTALQQAAFFNHFSFRNPVALATQALLAARSGFDRLALIHSMVFFSAIHDAAVFDEFYTSLAGDAAAWAIPCFAKAVCIDAIRRNDPVREREALVRYREASVQAEAPDPGSIPAAQKEEMRARECALARMDAGTCHVNSRSVFVGFYGQLRYHHHVLPKMVDYFLRDLPSAGVTDIRFGLATWRMTGTRKLSIHDVIDFYKDVLPTQLHNALALSGAVHGMALQRSLPHIAKRLHELHEERDARNYLADDASLCLPSGSILRMDDEESFLSMVSHRLPQVPPDRIPEFFDNLHFNQFRMWSRIAALRTIMEEHEARSGRPFDQVILIRTDLLIQGGSFASLLAEAAASPMAVISDSDPHAEYIEGIGDRYFVGNRDAPAPLFEGFDELLDKVRTASPLARRIHSHQAPASLLFSAGRKALSRDTVRYEFYRGRFPLSDFADAIMQDSQITSDNHLRHELQSVADQIRMPPPLETLCP